MTGGTRRQDIRSKTLLRHPSPGHGSARVPGRDDHPTRSHKILEDLLHWTWDHPPSDRSVSDVLIILRSDREQWFVVGGQDLSLRAIQDIFFVDWSTASRPTPGDSRPRPSPYRDTCSQDRDRSLVSVDPSLNGMLHGPSRNPSVSLQSRLPTRSPARSPPPPFSPLRTHSPPVLVAFRTFPKHVSGTRSCETFLDFLLLFRSHRPLPPPLVPPLLRPSTRPRQCTWSASHSPNLKRGVYYLYFAKLIAPGPPVVYEGDGGVVSGCHGCLLAYGPVQGRGSITFCSGVVRSTNHNM